MKKLTFVICLFFVSLLVLSCERDEIDYRLGSYIGELFWISKYDNKTLLPSGIIVEWDFYNTGKTCNVKKTFPKEIDSDGKEVEEKIYDIDYKMRIISTTKDGGVFHTIPIFSPNSDFKKFPPRIEYQYIFDDNKLTLKNNMGDIFILTEKQ